MSDRGAFQERGSASNTRRSYTRNHQIPKTVLFERSVRGGDMLHKLTVAIISQKKFPRCLPYVRGERQRLGDETPYDPVKRHFFGVVTRLLLLDDAAQVGSLLRRCLLLNPATRATAEELLGHSFFSGVD